MTEDLITLIRQGPSTRLERFEADTDLQRIAETLVALANSRRGGVLVLDLTHEDVSEVIDRVVQAALAISPPLIIPTPDPLEVDGVLLVVTLVPPGMPHVYALDGHYLWREQGRSATIHPHALRRLFMERGEVSFEMEIARDATLDDLDQERIKQYAKQMNTIDIEHLLLKRGCVVRRRGELYPTHAGILLFGRDPLRFVRGAEITAARFAGETMSDTFSREDIGGTLPDQIRRAETFLLDHLRRDVSLQAKMERQELYEYPLEAARELVVNAVAHRDYAIGGDGIRLYLFKNRMEIISPGRLPGPVTVDNIVEERFSRNPAIVQVLSDMGFIERLGYGVDRVIELMEQQNLRAPEFCETDGGFRVRLYNLFAGMPVPEFYATLDEYRNVALNPRQETALAYLQVNNRITNSELQRLHPDVHPETIRRDLADLVTRSILSKMGEKRGSYYILRRDDG